MQQLLYTVQVFDLTAIFQETAKNGLEGKLPTVTGMKLTNKHMVKRNLTVGAKASNSHSTAI